MKITLNSIQFNSTIHTHYWRQKKHSTQHHYCGSRFNSALHFHELILNPWRWDSFPTIFSFKPSPKRAVSHQSVLRRWPTSSCGCTRAPCWRRKRSRWRWCQSRWRPRPRTIAAIAAGRCHSAGQGRTQHFKRGSVKPHRPSLQTQLERNTNQEHHWFLEWYTAPHHHIQYGG